MFHVEHSPALVFMENQHRVFEILEQMATLSDAAISALLQPYLVPPAALLPQLSAYLDLLLKWNARTNLTAIREPEEIVRRHFGESLFAARHLTADTPDLLDLGSGAGFPGLPIALLRPDIRVTLAESQHKKASFLREAVRTLGLSAEVWADRAEAMPVDRRFHTVALRAVDNMAAAVAAAEVRAVRQVVLLTSAAQAPELPEFAERRVVPVPGSQSSVLLIASRG
jgi:16S rRNA (guanine527-N7)-methyltransferase